MTAEPTQAKQDKQITVEVPEERVAEFCAFYGRFLAAAGRRGRGHRGHRHHGRHCGHRHDAADAPGQATSGPEVQTV